MYSFYLVVAVASLIAGTGAAGTLYTRDRCSQPASDDVAHHFTLFYWISWLTVAMASLLVLASLFAIFTGMGTRQRTRPRASGFLGRTVKDKGAETGMSIAPTDEDRMPAPSLEDPYPLLRAQSSD